MPKKATIRNITATSSGLSLMFSLHRLGPVPHDVPRPERKQEEHAHVDHGAHPSEVDGGHRAGDQRPLDHQGDGLHERPQEEAERVDGARYAVGASDVGVGLEAYPRRGPLGAGAGGGLECDGAGGVRVGEGGGEHAEPVDEGDGRPEEYAEQHDALDVHQTICLLLLFTKSPNVPMNRTSPTKPAAIGSQLIRKNKPSSPPSTSSPMWPYLAPIIPTEHIITVRAMTSSQACGPERT